MDRGIFYLQGRPGEAWNGLVSVNESDGGSTERVRHIDGQKFFRQRTEEFSGIIEAFTYPDSFHDHILTQRRHKSFGLSYRVKSGNGYKIHLVYNVTVIPPSFLYQMNQPDLFRWDFTTKPVHIPGAKPSAHLVIPTTDAYSWTVSALEEVLYGSESEDPRLPSPEEVLAIFEENSIVQVIDHGDGTFTVTGPDSVIQMLDLTTFQIDWPSVVYIDSETYQISSL